MIDGENGHSSQADRFPRLGFNVAAPFPEIVKVCPDLPDEQKQAGLDGIVKNKLQESRGCGSAVFFQMLLRQYIVFHSK
ncbi:hypothetical protein R6Z07F_020343 [Ovis aries]